MRKIKITIIFFVLILLFSSNAFAMEDISASLEIEKIEENIPNEVKNELFPDGFDIKENYSYKFGFSTVFSFITSVFPDVLKNAISNFAKILAILIIASLFSNIKDSFASEGLKSILSLITLLCIFAASFSIINSLFESAKAYIDSICVFMGALTPSLAILSAYSGNVSSSAITATNVMLILTLIQTALSEIFFPCLKICFCISLASSLSNTLELKGISTFAKNTLITSFLFLMSFMGAIMGYQHVIAKSADSISLRSIRFAAGNFIPVVGSSLSEAMSSVLTVVSQMKNSLGALASIIIIAALLPIILKLILNRIFISFSASCASMLGLQRESIFIKEISATLGVALAICAASSVLFLFAIGLFLSSGVTGG